MDDEYELAIDDASPDAPLLGAESPSHPKRCSAWCCLPEKPHTISMLMCLAIFLWVLSGTLVMVPGTRLAEDIICQRYYGRDTAIDEEMCKTDEVQSHLAYILGFSAMLIGIVNMLVAFPFGVLADRGRKPVYLLAAFGQFSSVVWTLTVCYCSDTLPIELALLGPIFGLCGGGITVAIAILFAIISDTQAPENRAVSYFFLSLSAEAGVFIGPPIGSIMMGRWSPWAPLSMVPIISLLAGAVILLVPETAQKVQATADEDNIWMEIQSRGWWRATRSHLARQLKQVKSLRMLKRRPVVLILLTFMITAPFGHGTTSTFLQYFSKRFDKTLEDAGYMVAIKGGLTVLMVGVVLPGLSKLLSSSLASKPSVTFRKDLVLAQASTAFLLFGFLGLAGPDLRFVVAGLVVLTWGSGLTPLCRSLVTVFAEPGETSQLFTLISIIENLGSLPAGPLLAWAFSTGMRLQGFWIGLPFIFLGFLSLLALGALSLVRKTEATTCYTLLPTEDPLDGAASVYSLDEDI